MATPIITVGICTRNRPHSILTAAESVLANNHGNFELIIIDQSTDTDTEQALAQVRADPRVRYISSMERGVSCARNTVLNQARGEIVLMTDDDCHVPTDWIEQMSAVFERHPRAGLIFCRVEAGPFDPQEGTIPVFLCEGEHMVEDITWNTRISFLGAGMGLRRTIALSIGAFDVTLGAGGTFPSAEEVDIGIRAILHNIPIVCTDATQIVHYGFRSWQQLHALMVRNYTGFGAMLGKLIRSGHWPVGLVLLSFSYNLAGIVFGNVLSNRRPLGLRHFVWLCRGLYYGWGMPVHRDTGKFALSARQAEKLAFLLVDA